MKSSMVVTGRQENWRFSLVAEWNFCGYLSHFSVSILRLLEDCRKCQRCGNGYEAKRAARTTRA